MGIMAVRKWAHQFLAPVIIVLVIGLTIGLFYIGLPMASQQSNNYHGPAAEVSGEKIKDADFNQALLEIHQMANSQGAALPESFLLNEALITAVKKLALEQEKHRVKIRVSGAEVEQFLNRVLPTEEARLNFMGRAGITEKELRKKASDIVSTRKMILYKARQFKIELNQGELDKVRDEVRAELEQITVSHILIGQGKDLRSEAAALQRANEVYQKVKADGDFAQLAREYSNDPGSREKGGQIGPMPLASFKTGMVKEFVMATLALKEDQVSRPVKTQYGYHIIRLDSLTMPQGSEYKKKLQEAEEDLLVQKTSKLYGKWEQNLISSAIDNMKILDPGLKAYRFGLQGKWQEATMAYEKALKRSYYKKRWSFHYDAAQAYIQAGQPQDAVKLLRKLPAEGREGIKYQLALANAYRADNKLEAAQKVLADYSQGNPDDIEVHQNLKEVYTDWKLPQLAAAEEQIIVKITRLQAEKLQLEQRNQELKSKNIFQKTTEPTSGK